MADWREPHKELKCCKGCKVLNKTTCDYLETISLKEQLSGKCLIRAFVTRILEIDSKDGKHYEQSS